MATAGASLWSTTAATNSTADPAVNAAEGMAPSALNDSMRAMMASVAKWRDDRHGITTGGTATAYTVTTNSTFATTAAMSGYVFTIIPNATNTSATTTLAVDGLTAYQLNQSTGVGAPAGSLIIGTPYQIKYVHATTEFIVFGLSTLAITDIIGGTSNASIATDDTLPTYDLSATANRRMLVSDFLKVTNLLTADSSPDVAADFVMTYDASAAAAKKVLLSDFPGRLGRGDIDGCILSNTAGDPTNDISVSAGVCRDSTNAVDITVAALAGKQIDANWAAGASAGMRNSAAGIANTTYHIYAVRTAASATADIYAHTSATVATVLTALQAESGGSSYLYARRIGSIIRESAALVSFVQNGDRFERVPKLSQSSLVISTTAQTATVHSPAGLIHEVILSGYVINLANAEIGYIYNPALADFALSSYSGPAQWGGENDTNQAVNDSIGTITVFTNITPGVRIVANASQTMNLWTMGWIDARGKNA